MPMSYISITLRLRILTRFLSMRMVENDFFKNFFTNTKVDLESREPMLKEVLKV